MVEALELALLIASMLPIDRAEANARDTLHLAGFYGAKVSCQASDPGYVCLGQIKDGYVILLCSGWSKEECTARVIRKGHP